MVAQILAHEMYHQLGRIGKHYHERGYVDAKHSAGETGLELSDEAVKRICDKMDIDE